MADFAPATDPLIRFEGVYKFHRTDTVETAALNGLNLTVHRGEFLAVMGPSGSGKSTLLNILGLIDEPSRGAYHFRTAPTDGLSTRGRARIRSRYMSFVFQSFNLLDELTAFENVELPLIYQGVGRAQRRERAEAALADLEMLHRRDHYPGQLSGGQQQRVAIARAVVTRPELILADEPTGNLDSKNGAIVMEKLSAFHAAGTTIVMVTHSATDAAHAGRVLQLFDGNELRDKRRSPALSNQ